MTSGLFDGLDAPALEELRAELRPRELAAGGVLCRAGDRSDSLYVVERGLLQVLDDSGAHIGRQRAGDVVGEAALLTGEARSATVLAQVPSVVSELSRDAFLSAAARHPRLLANLATIVSRRLVARTAAPAARVTALVTRPAGWAGTPTATMAAQACSAAPLTVVDTLGPLPELLSRIELSAADGPVLLRVPSDFEDLSELLGHCDRTFIVRPAGKTSHARQDVWPDVSPDVLPGDAELIDSRVDPARLGRRIAGASIGIALGGGGAKGWAHVGVLRSLQRAGYAVDAVAGTSVGAWVGAWAAMGLDADAIEQLMRERFDEYAVHAIFTQGGAQGTAVMTRMARETTADATFRDLEVPLTVLAADLSAQQPAVFDKGSVATALVTAMTVPGLYPPVRRGDQRLVDAVVIAPVPTAAVHGVDVTIAVNTLARQAMPAWPGSDPEPAPRDRDPVVESLELASHAAATAQTAEAAIGLTPRFGPGTWRDFHHAERFLAAGEEAMEAALPALAALARPPHSAG